MVMIVGLASWLTWWDTWTMEMGLFMVKGDPQTFDK